MSVSIRALTSLSAERKSSRQKSMVQSPWRERASSRIFHIVHRLIALGSSDIGPTGISGTKYLPPPLAPIVKDVNAIVAMRNALMAQPANSAWLVATGPLTNIGLLFATFPEVAPHIAGLSIMGGAVGGGFTGIPSGKTLGQSEGFGNETPWAEFNIYCDPEAAQAVFSNPVLATKTTLICLDLTHQCLATKQVRESLLYAACSAGPSKSPTKLRVLLNEILEFFAASYDEFFDIKAGPPLHDPLAVAVLFGFATSKLKGPHPVIFQDDGERYTIFVVTAGEHSASDAIRGQVGRTVVKASDTTGHGVRIPRKLNVEAFWRVLEDCCSIAEKHVALQQA